MGGVIQVGRSSALPSPFVCFCLFFFWGGVMTVGGRRVPSRSRCAYLVLNGERAHTIAFFPLLISFGHIQVFVFLV